MEVDIDDFDKAILAEVIFFVDGINSDCVKYGSGELFDMKNIYELGNKLEARVVYPHPENETECEAID